MQTEELNERLLKKVTRIERLIKRLLEREIPKEWYSTAEFAKAVDRAEFTVREWCRLGRLRGEKRRTRCGAHQEWTIAKAEMERYRREGLLPLTRVR